MLNQGIDGFDLWQSSWSSYSISGTISGILTSYLQIVGPISIWALITWKGIASRSCNQGERLLHGSEEEDFEAKQKLSEVRAAVVGIVRMQHQPDQLLNFHSCTEQVCKHHYTELWGLLANH